MWVTQGVERRTGEANRNWIDVWRDMGTDGESRRPVLRRLFGNERPGGLMDRRMPNRKVWSG